MHPNGSQTNITHNMGKSLHVNPVWVDDGGYLTPNNLASSKNVNFKPITPISNKSIRYEEDFARSLIIRDPTPKKKDKNDNNPKGYVMPKDGMGQSISWYEKMMTKKYTMLKSCMDIHNPKKSTLDQMIENAGIPYWMLYDDFMYQDTDEMNWDEEVWKTTTSN